MFLLNTTRYVLYITLNNIQEDEESEKRKEKIELIKGMK